MTNFLAMSISWQEHFISNEMVMKNNLHSMK